MDCRIKDEKTLTAMKWAENDEKWQILKFKTNKDI